MSRVLVVAKAPVPGEVKTRLGATVGMEIAAELAAASLLDTLRACTSAFGEARCSLALAGDLGVGVRGAEIAGSLVGWHVFEQQGSSFADRLVHAHATLAARGQGPVVQIGMDTPQVTSALLLAVDDALGRTHPSERSDAVLGRAVDGGWWVLALRDGRRASCLRRVAMSTPTTYEDTLRALEDSGLRVSTTHVLRDVDTDTDAEEVAAAAPNTRFAEAWYRLIAPLDHPASHE